MVSTDIVQVDTGEIIQTRLSPAQAKQQANWLRDVMKAALTEGVDYGIIPGTGTKPTLWKAGAEMLLIAAGLGFTMDRVDDDASQAREGVTYKCSVHRGGTVVAVCDGYAGYEETSFYRRNGDRAPWNNVVKIAEKRALVGAALNAVAGSGLFVADLDDNPPSLPAVFDPIQLMRPHLALLDANGKGLMTEWSRQNNMPSPSKMSPVQVAAALVQIGRLAQPPACTNDNQLSGLDALGEVPSGPETNPGPAVGTTSARSAAGPADDLDDDEQIAYWLNEGWTIDENGEWHAP